MFSRIKHFRSPAPAGGLALIVPPFWSPRRLKHSPPSSGEEEDEEEGAIIVYGGRRNWTGGVSRIREELIEGSPMIRNTPVLHKEHADPRFKIQLQLFGGGQKKRVRAMVEKGDNYTYGFKRPFDSHWWEYNVGKIPGAVAITSFDEGYGTARGKRYLGPDILKAALSILWAGNPRSKEVHYAWTQIAIYFLEPARIRAFEAYLAPVMDSGIGVVEFDEKFKYLIDNWGGLSAGVIQALELGKEEFYYDHKTYQVKEVLKDYAILNAINDNKMNKFRRQNKAASVQLLDGDEKKVILMEELNCEVNKSVAKVAQVSCDDIYCILSVKVEEASDYCTSNMLLKACYSWFQSEYTVDILPIDDPKMEAIIVTSGTKTVYVKCDDVEKLLNRCYCVKSSEGTTLMKDQVNMVDFSKAVQEMSNLRCVGYAYQEYEEYSSWGEDFIFLGVVGFSE